MIPDFVHQLILISNCCLERETLRPVDTPGSKRSKNVRLAFPLVSSVALGRVQRGAKAVALGSVTLSEGAWVVPNQRAARSKV